MATIGDRIREMRMDAGMSQVEFAKHIGVSKQTLYKYENNIITNIPSDKIEAMASVLDVSPAQIMGWDNSAPEMHTDEYYIDNDARNIAQFLFENPEYRVLFDASRKVKKEDIEFFKNMMDHMSGKE